MGKSAVSIFLTLNSGYFEGDNCSVFDCGSHFVYVFFGEMGAIRYKGNIIDWVSKMVCDIKCCSISSLKIGKVEAVAGKAVAYRAQAEVLYNGAGGKYLVDVPVSANRCLYRSADSSVHYHLIASVVSEVGMGGIALICPGHIEAVADVGICLVLINKLHKGLQGSVGEGLAAEVACLLEENYIPRLVLDSVEQGGFSRCLPSCSRMLKISVIGGGLKDVIVMATEAAASDVQKGYGGIVFPCAFKYIGEPFEGILGKTVAYAEYFYGHNAISFIFFRITVE